MDEIGRFQVVRRGLSCPGLAGGSAPSGTTSTRLGIHTSMELLVAAQLVVSIAQLVVTYRSSLVARPPSPAGSRSRARPRLGASRSCGGSRSTRHPEPSRGRWPGRPKWRRPSEHLRTVAHRPPSRRCRGVTRIPRRWACCPPCTATAPTLLIAGTGPPSIAESPPPRPPSARPARSTLGCTGHPWRVTPGLPRPGAVPDPGRSDRGGSPCARRGPPTRPGSRSCCRRGPTGVGHSR